MPSFKTIDDIDFLGKTVLVRVDFNVPVQNGKVTDATRIERALPTIRALTAKGARIVCLSHFGRPKGQPNADMSLRPIADSLAEALGKPVAFAGDCIGAEAESVVAGLAEDGVALMENVRFHSGEEANDAGFARALARLGHVYVNDAFSAAHRAHASTEGLARLLPAAAGRAMQAELEALGAALENPKRPAAALVGGAKVSSKISILETLVSRVDALIVGGGMANTFLLALGHDMGKSLVEAEMLDTARAIMAKANESDCLIVLPTDAVCASEFKANPDTVVVPVTAVPTAQMMLDVGPDSAESLAELLSDYKTIVWNGPLGAFETPPFDAATNRVAQAAAALVKSGKLLAVAGGGDTVAALAHAGVVNDFTYVSTAGGAFLEWLEGRTLPGVAALEAAAG
jgi:phosphoglycerate kinase